MRRVLFVAIGGLIGAAVLDMTVDRVVAGIQLTAAEPSRRRFGIVIDDLVPFFVPVQLIRRGTPERIRVAQ